MDHGHVPVVALLPWSLFFFLGPLLNGQTEACQPGWFGKTCQYMCHCTNQGCDDKGNCHGTNTCQTGWFGPACQYVDLAYGSSMNPETTDGNDETCLNDSDVRRVTLRLEAHFYTKWVRVYLSKPGYAENMRPRFRHRNTFFACRNITIITLDERSADILCEINQDVNEVTIRGIGVGFLCSVHVSGGRNVALKQQAYQSSTFNYTTGNVSLVLYTANKTVDGNTNPDFFSGRSCSHGDPTRNGTWAVRMFAPRLVNRYAIYNRNTLKERLAGFRLHSYNGQGKRVFLFTDTNPVPQLRYTATHEDLEVQLVKITSSVNQSYLTLCEVEVFGESVCDYGYFGLDCERMCNCLADEDCFVSTGGCPGGCSTGYFGVDCSTPCSPDMHGHECSLNCSEFCVRSALDIRSCDHETGQCLRGCEIGYQPPTCESVCRAGTYGLGCGRPCSPACIKSSAVPGPFCDVVNGTCHLGCRLGYYGDTCSAPCPPSRYGKDCKSICSDACLAANDSDSSSCNHTTGDCLYGCAEGYSGFLCLNSINSLNLSEMLSMSKTELIATLTSAVLLAMLLAVCTVLLCQHKRTVWSPDDEASDEDTGSEHSEV